MNSRFIYRSICLIFFILVVLASMTASGCENVPSNMKSPNAQVDVKISSFGIAASGRDVEFTLLLYKNQYTEDSGRYKISILSDGNECNSMTVVYDASRGNFSIGKNSYSSSIRLLVFGSSVDKMLADLNKNYENAKSKYDDYYNEKSWDLLTGRMRGISYDDYQKVLNKVKQLKDEMEKWNSYRTGRNGTGISYNQEFESFCRRYIGISVHSLPSSP